jgi:membrane-associated phospholipid phosphatase
VAADTSHLHDTKAMNHPFDLAIVNESGDRAEARAAKPVSQVSLAWPIVAALGLGGFALMTVLIAGHAVFPFDQPLLDAGQRLSPYMDAWRGLSDSANFPLIAVGVAIVLSLLAFRRWREAVIVVVLLVAVTAGSEIVKQLVARPRPQGYDEATVGIVYSFPSGHVLEAVTMYGIIAVLVWRSALPTVLRVLIPLVFTMVVILVAIARVAVAAHYPSDVLASAFCGLGCLALFAWSAAILERRRTRQETATERDAQ